MQLYVKSVYFVDENFIIEGDFETVNMIISAINSILAQEIGGIVNILCVIDSSNAFFLSTRPLEELLKDGYGSINKPLKFVNNISKLFSLVPMFLFQYSMII